MNERIVWVDVETTGLQPRKDLILEIAVVITDTDLKQLGHVVEVIRPLYLDLLALDPHVLAMHSRSGLLADILTLGIPELAVETKIHELLERCDVPTASPLGGSSVHFDRACLEYRMPDVIARLGHRNLDVSTLRMLANVWMPEIAWQKADKHRAVDDIYDSIEELKSYRTALYTEGAPA